mgnify:CR=1 FL=1
MKRKVVNFGIDVEKKTKNLPADKQKSIQDACVERFAKMIKNNRKRIIIKTEYEKPSDERRTKEKYMEKRWQHEKDVRDGIVRRKRSNKRRIKKVETSDTNTIDFS